MHERGAAEKPEPEDVCDPSSDHAKDERDRNLREHRIKALNVAWDLIRSPRREAA